MAVVIHAAATNTVINNEAYQKKYETDNPYLDLYKELADAGVELIVCGQSLMLYKNDANDIVPQVKIATSALTAVSTYQLKGYPSDEAYLYALADVMQEEYNAIVEAGLLLQIDCPDLAMTRVTQFAHLTVAEFKNVVEMHVEALNHALQGIAPERMRLHLCWGNYEGPHHHDVPLREIVEIVLTARPAGLSFEGANPRHAHEWKVWQEVNLPDGKTIIPGVLDSTTNFIEHPELVAQRIVQYADVVGRENVMASSD